MKFFKRFTPCNHKWIRIGKRVNKHGERLLYIDVQCIHCKEEAKSWNASWEDEVIE